MVCRCPQQVNVPSSPIVIPDDILAALKNSILCIEIFYVDQLKFMVTLLCNLHFATVKFILNWKHDTILEAMNNAISLYKYFNFKVHSLLADGEFAGLHNKFLAQGVLINVVAAHDHVGDIERYIQVIKEWV